MNQINEATRMREANKEKADGEKILLVKAAEADCDAKKLAWTHAPQNPMNRALWKQILDT